MSGRKLFLNTKMVITLCAYFASAFQVNAQATKSDPQLVINPLGHSGIINELIFTSDSKLLISVSEDKTIRVWNVGTGDLKRTIRPYSDMSSSEGNIYAAALSPDNNYLAIGGFFKSNAVRIISLQRQQDVILLEAHENIITHLEFSNDGKFLASSGTDNKVIIWSLSTHDNKLYGQQERVLEGAKKQIYDFSFAPDGGKIAAVSYDGTLLVWSTANGELLNDDRMHIDQALSVSFSNDGSKIFTGGNKGKVLVWDANGNYSTKLIDIEDRVGNIIVNSDGKVLITSNRARLMSGSSVTTTFNYHKEFITAAAISGTYAATASSAQGKIFIWNTDNGQPIKSLVGKGTIPYRIGISDNTVTWTIDKRSNSTENSFNFNDLKFGWGDYNLSNYRQAIHENNGYKLIKVDEYTLSTGFSGSIINDKRYDGRILCYTILSETRIAVGSQFSLKIYSETGDLISRLPGHNGQVLSFANNLGGKYLFSSGGDQTIKVWNIDTGENLATLFLADNNEWVIWSPDGYYAASAGGEKYLGWQVNYSTDKLSSYYPSHAFRNKYFQPEYIKKIIQTGEAFKPKEELLEQSIKENEVVKLTEKAPIITWLEPIEYQTNTSNTSVKAKVKITSETDLKSVKILLQGRNIPTKRDVSNIPDRDVNNEYVVEFDIPLVNVESTIQIFAATETARMVSDERVVIYQGSKDKMHSRDQPGNEFMLIDYELKPDLYLLSIGISNFKDEQYNLSYADDDAKSITETFITQENKIFHKVYNKDLYNGSGSKNDILSGFSWLEKEVKSKDVVMIFIASHGMNYRDQFYILPYDGDVANLESTLISWEHFVQVLSKLPGKVVLFLDACHSGQLGSNLKQMDLAVENTEAFRELSSIENGVIIMSGSTGSESSLESDEWKHGAFSLAILEGLQQGKADIKQDGVIYLRELDFYVSERVSELTNNNQHPTTQKPSSISRLPLYKLN